MDNFRINNLKLWIDREFEGRVANFCRYYNLSRSRASFISQLISGHRTLGEKAARKLEEETKRPKGWLDSKPAKAENGIKFDRDRVAQLPKNDKKLIEDFIEFVLNRSDFSKIDNKLLTTCKQSDITNEDVRDIVDLPISEKSTSVKDNRQNRVYKKNG